MKRISGLFDCAYSEFGRVSIPLDACSVTANTFYHSQRANGKNRDRLLDHDIVNSLFVDVIELAQKRQLISNDHFSVDGTLIQTWVSQKSFQLKDNGSNDSGGGRNAEHDFHGEKCSNETHASKTNSNARNYKKSKNSEAKLAYFENSIIENRNGLVVNIKVSLANGFGERDSAIDMLAELPGEHRKTVAADKNYDTQDFVASCQ